MDFLYNYMIKGMFMIKFAIKYRNNNIFYFTQGLTINLIGYERKLKPQSQFKKTKIISDGACFAIVLYSMKFMGELYCSKNLSPDNIFAKLKTSLSDSKEMMHQYFYWMGLQELIYSEFNADNLNPNAYNPSQDVKLAALNTDILNKNKDLITGRVQGARKSTLENIRKSIQDKRSFYDSKMNYLLNNLKLKGKVNYNYTNDQLVNNLFFANDINWIEHGKLLESDKLTDIKKEIEDISNSFFVGKISPLHKLICLSTGMEFKDGGHQICLFITRMSNA
jgi:hypothetical protein